MMISVPIENQEIPQTGLGEETAVILFQPEQVKGARLYYNAEDKRMHAEWQGLKNADSYSYQFYTSPINPANTVVKANTVERCRTRLGGLPRGQRVLFRVRANVRNYTGPWSEPVEKRVP
jgi:hypothetical protein